MNPEHPYRVQKHIKYNEYDSIGNILPNPGMGKILKKDDGRCLVYILQGKNRGNRRWVSDNDIINESVQRSSFMNNTAEVKKIILSGIAESIVNEEGSAVSSAGSLKVGTPVTFTFPDDKLKIKKYGVVAQLDEARKEVVLSGNSDFADYAMKWFGQPVRIPYGKISQFQVKVVGK